MLRQWMVSVLMLGYLLVTLATNVPTAHAVKYAPGYNADAPFVHAPDCQHRFYLQVDCFDKCNAVQADDHQPTHPVILLQAGGFDYHTMAPLLATHYQAAMDGLLHQDAKVVAPIPGFATIQYPPPVFA